MVKTALPRGSVPRGRPRPESADLRKLKIVLVEPASIQNIRSRLGLALPTLQAGPRRPKSDSTPENKAFQARQREGVGGFAARELEPLVPPPNPSARIVGKTRSTASAARPSIVRDGCDTRISTHCKVRRSSSLIGKTGRPPGTGFIGAVLRG